jgi:hypothetical protein
MLLMTTATQYSTSPGLETAATAPPLGWCAAAGRPWQPGPRDLKVLVGEEDSQRPSFLGRR